jgi:hypothetical protein
VTVQAPVTTPYVAIDTPGQNTTVTPPFTLSGWAVDTAAPTGTGIDAITVWAYPTTSGAAPINVGSGAYGSSRPDIGTLFGDTRFTSSGYSLTVGASTLAAGVYDLVVFAHSTVTSGYTATAVVRVTVQIDAREMALAAVQQEYDSLPGQDLAADAQTMLAFLSTRPEFVSAGVTDLPRTVWAAFSDGRVILMEFSRDIQPAAARARRAVTALATRSQNDLPHSSKARILTALGGLWSDPTTDITTMLNAAGYSFVIGADASVESLKTVGGDGVFYIDSHGGRDGLTGRYHIVTSTIRTRETDAKYLDDLNAARLSIGLTHDYPIPFSPTSWHYTITTDFVTEYWKDFAPGAFVYIDACSSDAPTPAAQSFKAAIRAKGSPVYAGWTGDVRDSDSTPTAKFVFDRLLGANRFDLETGFKQRPFDYPSAVVDMPKHGRGTSKGTTVLQFTPPAPGPGDFQLLAPSIMVAVVVEPPIATSPQLYLNGLFGPDPRPDGGAASVTVDGTERTISSWSADGGQIITDIPAFGSGSSGDVVVTVRGHKSNVARITEWLIQFSYTLAGQGTLSQPVTYTVDYRTDIRKYRRLIHDPPSEPFGATTMMQSSLASFTCGGSATYTAGSSTDTYTWNGSGNLVPKTIGGPVNNFEDSVIIGDSRHLLHSMDENENYQACNYNVHHHVCTDTGCTDSDSPGKEALFGLHAAFGNLAMALDDSANIISGSLQMNEAVLVQPPPGTAQLQVQWSQLSVKAPPDPDSAR